MISHYSYPNSFNVDIMHEHVCLFESIHFHLRIFSTFKLGMSKFFNSEIVYQFMKANFMVGDLQWSLPLAGQQATILAHLFQCLLR